MQISLIETKINIEDNMRTCAPVKEESLMIFQLFRAHHLIFSYLKSGATCTRQVR